MGVLETLGATTGAGSLCASGTNLLRSDAHCRASCLADRTVSASGRREVRRLRQLLVLMPFFGLLCEELECLAAHSAPRAACEASLKAAPEGFGARGRAGRGWRRWRGLGRLWGSGWRATVGGGRRLRGALARLQLSKHTVRGHNDGACNIVCEQACPCGGAGVERGDVEVWRVYITKSFEY